MEEGRSVGREGDIAGSALAVHLPTLDINLKGEL